MHTRWRSVFVVGNRGAGGRHRIYHLARSKFRFDYVRIVKRSEREEERKKRWNAIDSLTGDWNFESCAISNAVKCLNENKEYLFIYARAVYKTVRTHTHKATVCAAHCTQHNKQANEQTNKQTRSICINNSRKSKLDYIVESTNRRSVIRCERKCVQRNSFRLIVREWQACCHSSRPTAKYVYCLCARTAAPANASHQIQISLNWFIN